jgi:hypothetical protein
MNTPSINHFIEIYWEGPFTLKEVLEKRNPAVDYGLYQIYGNHEIHGPQSLLYIGMANELTFAARFDSHKNWLVFESQQADIYLGYFGNRQMKTPGGAGWRNQIKMAEEMLIYYCSPPYNSKSIFRHPDLSGVVLMNYGYKYRLPFTLNSFVNDLYNGQILPYGNENDKTKEGNWKKFGSPLSE